MSSVDDQSGVTLRSPIGCGMSIPMTLAKSNGRLRTVGVWLGFTEPVNLHREGIGRFMRSLCSSLSGDHHLSFEFWCYEINRIAVNSLFHDLLKEDSHKQTARIFTEQGSRDSAAVQHDGRDGSLRTLSHTRRLEDVAQESSNADVFLVYSPMLYNVLSITQPKVVYVPDLVPLVYTGISVAEDRQISESRNELRRALKAFSDSGAAFCCNSPFVAREHLTRHLPADATQRVYSVFLPGIPPDVTPEESDVNETKAKFGLIQPYLFYPTQNRPYKRLELLLQTLAQLNRGGSADDRGISLDLVLTASGASGAKLKAIADGLGVGSQVHFLGDVSSFDLYALHRGATVTVVTTLFEGGFPWQAIESMMLGTPVVLSKIPVVEERIQNMTGVSANDLLLFEPDNRNDLCAQIKHAVRHRETVVQAQNRVMHAFCQYTWSDVATQYRQIMAAQMHAPRVSVRFASPPRFLQSMKLRLKHCWPISCIHDLYIRVQHLEQSQGVLKTEIEQLRNEILTLRKANRAIVEAIDFKEQDE